MKNKYKLIQSRLTITSLLILTFLSLTVQGAAQSETKIFQEWAKYKGAQDVQQYTKSIIDVNKNIYIIGSTLDNDDDYDILVVKYNKQGVLLWEDIIDGTANSDDYGTDIILDAAGDVYITGVVTNTTTAHDLILRKYTSSGTELWTEYYNSSNNLIDAGTALTVSPTSGDVFVAGVSYSTTSFADYLILKYNSSGTQQWIQTYDHITLQDFAVKIVYAGGSIIVSGISEFQTGKWEIATIRITGSTGSIGAITRTGGSNEGVDEVTDVVVDDDENIYIVGAVDNTSTGYDMKIIKLDINLDIEWTHEINGPASQNDLANAVEVDDLGNVYVTGYVSTTNNSKDYYTCKYNSSGVLQWSTQYDGEDHGDDQGTDLVLDDTGNIYVTGSSFHLSNKDFYTVKYTNAGVALWDIHFNSEANLDDRALAIDIDDNGDLVVIGQVDFFDGKKRYYTVKYSEKDIIMPPDEEITPNSFFFVENRGQLKKTNGNPANNIRFYNTQTYPAMFVSDANVHLQFQAPVSDSTNDHHRVDVTFNKGNNSKKVYALEQGKTYSNYLSESIDGGERERLYHQAKVFSPEVWTDIDMIYSSNNDGIKIYYVCKPGFNSSDINVEFAGQDGLSMSGSDLVIENSISDLTLTEGEAYQVNANGVRLDMTWQPSYSINGNSVGLNIGSYDSSLPLIIELDQGNSTTNQVQQDANLLWSTFYGGGFSDETHSNAINDNIMWICGRSSSEEFLENIGGLEELANNQDAFVSMWNLDLAEELWRMRLVGNDSDVAYDVDYNPFNSHCFVVGGTRSTDFIGSSTVGENDFTHNGVNDGYIVELNELGFFDPFTQVRSYIGGSGADICTGIEYEEFTADASIPRIYIVGYTTSDNTSFPILSPSGVYNQTSSPNQETGFIMRLGTNKLNEWCTYFGSDSRDMISDIKTSPTGFAIVGKTQSGTFSNSCSAPTNNGFPICDLDGGSEQNTNIGGGGLFFANFVAEFIGDNLNWSTYFGGMNVGNVSYFYGLTSPSITKIPNDPGNNLYVTGNINSNVLNSVNSPNAGAYNLPFQNQATGILCKYNAARQTTWRTYLGSPNLFLHDIVGFNDGGNKGIVLVGSSAAGNATLPLSVDCQLPQVGEFPFCDDTGLNYTETTGPSNFRMFFMSFNEYDDIQWSSFYGQGELNTFNSVATDNDKLVMVGRGSMNNTIEEFDPISGDDYYRPVNTSTAIDGTIAMFDLSNIVNGIAETQLINGNSQFWLSPNPFADNITIYSRVPLNQVSTLKLYNDLGQLVISDKMKSGSVTKRLYTSQLSNGIYIVHISDENGVLFTSKIIKD